MEIINTISTLKCIIVSKVESNTGLKTGNVPDFLLVAPDNSICSRISNF